MFRWRNRGQRVVYESDREHRLVMGGPVEKPAPMTFDPNGKYTVAWDYSAFPVWVQTKDTGAVHVTISYELEQALQGWCDRVSDAMLGQKGDETLSALDAEGADLAGQLGEALGSAATVEYVRMVEGQP